MARGVGGHGPANIMKHMKGLHFPASKQEIIDHVQQGPGPDTQDVLEILRNIPDRQYDSPAGILHEVGQIE